MTDEAVAKLVERLLLATCNKDDCTSWSCQRNREAAAALTALSEKLHAPCAICGNERVLAEARIEAALSVLAQWQHAAEDASVQKAVRILRGEEPS